ERAVPLWREDRLIHPQLTQAGREITRADRPRFFRLMFRIQVLEEHAQCLATFERRAQPLPMETRDRGQRLPEHLQNPGGSCAEAGESLLERFDHQASEPAVVRLSSPRSPVIGALHRVASRPRPPYLACQSRSRLAVPPPSPL